jgi:hypothetical protein
VYVHPACSLALYLVEHNLLYGDVKLETFLQCGVLVLLPLPDLLVIDDHIS